MPRFFYLLPALLSILLGCSNKPAAIKPPAIDAASAADKAMELFDSNGDGAISGDELDATPGIKGALKRIDADENQAVSREELANRLRQLVESKAGTLAATCSITMRGKPLSGATVLLEPEPFLEDVVSSAKGVTDIRGMAGLYCQAVQGGMQLGLYRIRITKEDGGKETIPAKYNENTILGTEISSSSAAVTSTRGLMLDLKP